MNAALLLLALAAVWWALLRDRGRRRRWKEADRLSRCLFAAAGVRRRWR